MQQEIATDILGFEETYVRASTGKRFLNYIIDIVVFYVLIFLFSFFLALLAPGLVNSMVDGDSGLMDRVVGLILYALYMSVTEALLKGRSIGKFITGTKAVNLDGSNISTTTAFARGFSRAVPFCVLSAFGDPCNPWQDSWTNTMVVNVQKAQVLGS